LCSYRYSAHPNLPSFPTRRSSDLNVYNFGDYFSPEGDPCHNCLCDERWNRTKNPLESVCTRTECHFDFERPEHKGCAPVYSDKRSEEHTSELQSRFDLVCRLLLEK